MADKWQTKKAFPETNIHMLDDEILCDVTFLTGESSQPVKAHKFILASRSPVFHAMLCGPLAESSDAIKIPDIEKDVFRRLLRYLYAGTCEISADTIMALMYAANKYEVVNLLGECSDYLESSMSPGNVCDVLEQAHIFDNKILVEKCTNFINKNGKACLESEEFLSLSKQMLIAVVASDKLYAHEKDVYAACVRWAKEECKRTGKGDSDADCRAALGDVVKLIRFPTMTLECFSSVVSVGNILTSEEKISLFQYFASREKNTDGALSVCTFSCKYRDISELGDISKLVTITRCPDVYGLSWKHRGKTDAISFSSSKSAMFRGVGLYSPSTIGTTKGKLEIIRGDTVLLSMNVTLQYDKDVKHSDIMFDRPITIEKDVVYTVAQTFTGVITWVGVNGCQTVNHDEFTVTFSESDKSKNGTGVGRGQIKHLFLIPNCV